MTRNPNTRVSDLKAPLHSQKQSVGFAEGALGLFVTGVALVWAVIVRHFFY